MKKGLTTIALLLLGLIIFNPLYARKENKEQSKKIATFGVAFYNLENLFDTINNNGKYDLEFSPAGDRQWEIRPRIFSSG